jgi:ABC-type transport system involved in cytochrome c biogenesis permease component
VQILPIVERELRVAARQPKTWWRRLLTTAAALVVFSFFYLIFSQIGIPGIVGSQTFNALTIFGMLCSLLAGPLATADCLSRERREGTLGLLFLTQLRSPDVVLGKTAAASLDLVFGLVALIPVVALSMMLGGADVGQVVLAALTLFNIMFLSLATGLLASSVMSSGRVALTCTVLVLFGLTVCVPALGDALGLRFNNRGDTWFYVVCPSYAVHWCLRGVSGRQLLKTWEYWLNMGGMLVLAWTFLALACLRTAQGWQDLPVSAWALRWNERLARWSKGSPGLRRRWRQAMLEHNPIAWLEGRDRIGESTLWLLILGCMVLCSGGHLLVPQWPNQDFTILWPLWTHYILCTLIAIHAPRRLADDKQSGALELLLCTPLPPAEIVRGSMLSLRRRYGRTLLGMLVLDVFLVYAYLTGHGGWGTFWGNRGEMVWLSLCGLTVFPCQAWCLARVGLSQGLVQGNSSRATFLGAWKLGVLPWVLFALFLAGCSFTMKYLTGSSNIDDAVGYSGWILIHLAVCGACLARAQWRLRWHFRLLAAPRVPQPWWKRFWAY